MCTVEARVAWGGRVTQGLLVVAGTVFAVPAITYGFGMIGVNLRPIEVVVLTALVLVLLLYAGVLRSRIAARRRRSAEEAP